VERDVACRRGRAIVALLCAVTLLANAPVQAELRPTAREGAAHAVPLYGELVRTWDAPKDDPYAPGHRGSDVAAPEGSAVRASSAGTVSFAGSVAGNHSVTVDHSVDNGEELLTTYSFLREIAVTKGQSVEGGTVVGTVGAGHANTTFGPHVHLSARRNGTYFDPIGLYLGSDYSGLLALTR
jgi:murein DD-endopeptidase MepM/ murein hydrolase activator NlpD